MVDLKTSSLGGYRIIAKLGAGGMASVFLAVSVGKGGFRKLVVVKVLHDKCRDSPEFLQMFLAEARLAARLSHPNVVQTFEVGEDQGYHFIAMEYLEGQSYASVIKKLGRNGMKLETHLKILCDLLNGLHYAHQLEDFDGRPLGVVHRDISPQNVFICYDGQVKLLDFGVAKAACSDQETRAGVIKGKLAYLAPEQITSSPVDRRTDLFSVGVLLWEAIVGRKFASGTVEAATLHNRVTGGEPRIGSLSLDVPKSLAEICDKAIAISPADRFQTALEMRAALENYLETRREHSRQSNLAELVTDAFSEERSSMKTIVEEHVLLAPSVPPGAAAAKDANIIDLAPAGTGMNSQPSASAVYRTNHSAPTEAKAGNGKYLLFAAVALAAAAVMVYVGIGRKATELPPAPMASAPAASAPGQPDTPRADTVAVVVVASPPSAKLFVDGVPLNSNPFKADFKRDTVVHRVRAIADGFAEVEQLVPFDKDVHVTIALEPLGAASAAAPRHGARPVAPGAVTNSAVTPSALPPKVANAGDDLRSQPTGSSTRKIDEKDPYAK